MFKAVVLEDRDDSTEFLNERKEAFSVALLHYTMSHQVVQVGLRDEVWMPVGILELVESIPILTGIR